MAKTLELQFVTEAGKQVRLTIDNPKEPIDQAVVKQKMEEIIASDIFYTGSGNFASVQGARLVDRNVTEYAMA